MGWTGTLRPLWVPAAFGTAFNIFLLRQFFQRIPRSLPEAMIGTYVLSHGYYDAYYLQAQKLRRMQESACSASSRST